MASWVKIKVGYTQVLELVNQLPEKEMHRLIKSIQGKFDSPDKERVPIHELIMQAPTWTDEEYSSYLEVRKHINKSRLK